MPYLLVNHENKTYNKLWGPNCTHEDSNLIEAYNSALVAAYMYPCYEGYAGDNFRHLKMWRCAGNPAEVVINDYIIDSGIRSQYKSLTTLDEIEVKLPNNEKKINFAILCTLSVVINGTYRKWAVDYLIGRDKTKETALKVSEKIIKEKCIDNKLPVFQKIDSCHAAIAAVISDDPICDNSRHILNTSGIREATIFVTSDNFETRCLALRVFWS